jgi:hypothetical protein
MHIMSGSSLEGMHYTSGDLRRPGTPAIPDMMHCNALISDAQHLKCHVMQMVARLPFQFIVNPPLILNYFFACGLIIGKWQA